MDLPGGGFVEVPVEEGTRGAYLRTYVAAVLEEEPHRVLLESAGGCLVSDKDLQSQRILPGSRLTARLTDCGATISAGAVKDFAVKKGRRAWPAVPLVRVLLGLHGGNNCWLLWIHRPLSCFLAESMMIYVKTLTGKTITIDCHTYNTVADLKAIVLEKEGKRPAQLL